MKELNVGAIPVCDGKNLVGMVTDGDLVLRVMAQRRDPSTTTVRDTMTPEVYFCYEDEEAEIPAGLMAQQQIRRLPILSRAKQLIGLVSLGDLALDGVDSQSCGEVLKECLIQFSIGHLRPSSSRGNSDAGSWISLAMRDFC